MEDLLKCPVCGNQTLIPGERVDVGFGEANGAKCGPDHCETCEYVEQGPDPSDPPISHFIDCWKRGVSPWPKLPTLRPPRMLPAYAAWILANVVAYEDAYGKCREKCREMVLEFPELRRVYGWYICPTWGARHHFFCIDEENHIIDPTASQFPSGGTGFYQITRFYPLEFDSENVNPKSFTEADLSLDAPEKCPAACP